MSLINKEDLMITLGITGTDCEECGWYRRAARGCSRGSDFEDACCAIDDAPIVKPEPKWIPCSERLPDKEGNYLMTAQPTYNHTKDIRIAHWSGRWVGYNKSEILAWMPLPEPWKGEGD